MEILHFTEDTFPFNDYDCSDIRYWNIPSSLYRNEQSPTLGWFICVDGMVHLQKYGEDLHGNPVPYEETRHKVVGILMYFFTKDGKFELSYVSVRPEYQGKGISRSLLLKFCEWMRNTSKTPFLIRSRPGAVAPKAFTAKLDELYLKEGIDWEQTRYVETIDANGETVRTLSRIRRTNHTLSVCTSAY